MPAVYHKPISFVSVRRRQEWSWCSYSGKLLLANFTPLLTLADLSNEIASFAGVLRRNVAHCIRTYRFLRDLSSTSPVISMIIQLTLGLNRRHRVKISILFITRWPYMIACRRPRSHGEPRVDALTIVHFFAWFVHDSLTFSYSNETVDNQMLLYFYYFCFIVFYDFFLHIVWAGKPHTLCSQKNLRHWKPSEGKNANNIDSKKKCLG